MSAHKPGFQSFSAFFHWLFVLAKLATCNKRVKPIFLMNMSSKNSTFLIASIKKHLLFFFQIFSEIHIFQKDITKKFWPLWA